ncbi:ABC transporter substrate-binding protein [Primorskyibacter sp. S187A]|uniref:ABC transporter substrate-binding protein n=1 Tax=Primorskyibacter sp. S187A TaxID=3415130 RepID=UPI003C7DB0B3
MTRISRREMLQSGALAGVFAASGGPLMARGVRGGRLRAGLSGASASDSWDMRGATGLFMLTAGQGAVFECLTEVAADGALKGELAESWTSRDGARSWDIALRRGIVFHNGAELTAQDVLATLEHHGAEPALLAQIESVALMGTHDLRITLHAPNPSFLYELSHPTLAIQPANAQGMGVGTGLYRTLHFAPGARFLGQRVDDHWKGDSAGFADEVELIALNSAREQRAALKAGVVDVVSDLGVAAVGEMRGIRTQGTIAMTARVQTPVTIGQSLPMDNARFAQRWWLA